MKKLLKLSKLCFTQQPRQKKIDNYLAQLWGFSDVCEALTQVGTHFRNSVNDNCYWTQEQYSIRSDDENQK